MSGETRQNEESSVRIMFDDFLDLESLVKDCQSQLGKLSSGDYELSARFRTLYNSYNLDTREYVKVAFYRFSGELWRSEDRSATVSASVFREAAEVVTLFKAIQFYSSFAISCLESNGYS